MTEIDEDAGKSYWGADFRQSNSTGGAARSEESGSSWRTIWLLDGSMLGSTRHREAHLRQPMPCLVIFKRKGKGHLGVPSLEDAKQYPLTLLEQAALQKIKQKIMAGDPQKVARKLAKWQTNYQADEIMIVTITFDPLDKIRSYQFIAEEIE